MRVQVQNGSEIVSALKRLGPAARKTKRRALSAAGKQAVAAFVADVPVWSGATKKSVGIRRAKDDSLYIGVRKGPRKVKHPKTGVPLTKDPGKYAWVRDTKKPWFDASWKNISPQMAGLVEKDLNTAIAKEFKK
jgi:hypothetical protein